MQIGSSHNEPISQKFLKFSKKSPISPKILKNGSKNPQKSKSPFPSMSAAGILGPNLVSRVVTSSAPSQKGVAELSTLFSTRESNSYFNSFT